MNVSKGGKPKKRTVGPNSDLLTFTKPLLTGQLENMPHEGEERFGEGVEEVGLEGVGRPGQLSVLRFSGRLFQFISQEFILRALVRNIFKVLILTGGRE